MSITRPTTVILLLAGMTVTVIGGCARQVPAPVAETTSTTSVSPISPPVSNPPANPSVSSPMEMEIPSISLSSVVAAAEAEDAQRDPLSTDQVELRRVLFQSMKPLQIMLGSWHGTTQKEVGDFKGLDKSNWVWDLKTNRKQPAMVMTSDANPYFHNARLTYYPDRNIFEMQATDTEGQTRTLEGTFTQPAESFEGDDRLMHIKYKVELTQVEPPPGRDAWQLVFNQQDNNRFLIEIAKKRGNRFMRVDTIATQREGTSFARSDEGYGQRECIISGGLGTMPVTFKGTTYWVCCSGCKSAFEEEPEKWIAEYNAKKAAGDSKESGMPAP